MKKYARILMLALLLAVLLALAAWADEGAVVSVSSAQAEAGDTVTLELSLENNPGVAAVSVYLDYDAAKLRPLSYDISREANQRFMISLANESAGSVMMVALKDVDYSGVIAELEFEVLAGAVGEAEVRVTEAQLANFNDEAVPCQSETGVVSIEGGAAAPDSGENAAEEIPAQEESRATEDGSTPEEGYAPDENSVQDAGHAEDGAESSPSQRTEQTADVDEDDSAWIQDSVARFEQEYPDAVTANETTETVEPELTDPAEDMAQQPETPEAPESTGNGWLLLLAGGLLVVAAGVFVAVMLLRKKEKSARH